MLTYYRGDTVSVPVPMPADLRTAFAEPAVYAMLGTTPAGVRVDMALAGDRATATLALTPALFASVPDGAYTVSIWADYPRGGVQRLGGFGLTLRPVPGTIADARTADGFTAAGAGPVILNGEPRPAAFRQVATPALARQVRDGTVAYVVDGDSVRFFLHGIEVGQPGIAAEVATARGVRSSLNARISAISNFASPNAGGVIPGRYYDNAFQGAAATNVALVLDQVALAPFYTSDPLTVDQIGVSITTAKAGSGRCCIYAAGPDGWPSTLVWQGAAPFDTTASGYAYHAERVSIDAGRQYYMGVHTSAGPSIRAVNLGSAVNMGLVDAVGAGYCNIIRMGVPFGSLPAVFPMASAELAAVAPPSIRMRAAA